MSEELPVSPLDCEDDTDCSPGEGQSGLAIRRNISGKSWSLFFDKNVAGGTGQPFFTGRGRMGQKSFFSGRGRARENMCGAGCPSQIKTL